MNANRDLAVRFMEAIWRADVAEVDRLLTPDATWQFQYGMPQAEFGLGRIWPAREALDRIIADLFDRFDPEGFTVKLVRVIADEDAVAIEYESKGRTANGAEYRNTYCTVLVIRNHQVAEIHPYNDTTIMRRLLPQGE